MRDDSERSKDGTRTRYADNIKNCLKNFVLAGRYLASKCNPDRNQLQTKTSYARIPEIQAFLDREYPGQYSIKVFNLMQKDLTLGFTGKSTNRHEIALLYVTEKDEFFGFKKTPMIARVEAEKKIKSPNQPKAMDSTESAHKPEQGKPTNAESLIENLPKQIHHEVQPEIVQPAELAQSENQFKLSSIPQTEIQSMPNLQDEFENEEPN